MSEDITLDTEEIPLSSESITTGSKQTYSDIFDSSPLGYIVITRGGFIGNINATASRLTGLKRDEQFSRLFSECISAEEQEIFINCQQKLLETGTPQVCDIRVNHTDSGMLWLRLNLALCQNEYGSEILVTVIDITMQELLNEVQSFLLGSRWAESGRDFFEELAEYLAGILAMDYVCIDRLIEGNMEAQTVAVYFDGQIEENVRYTLADTPCGKVVDQEICFFPRDVCTIFPKDKVLSDMYAESYAGTTLFGSNGKPVGLIAVIGRKPADNRDKVEMVLKQVSIRAASELEHRQMRKVIENSQKELEILVRKRTKELQKTNETLSKEIRKRKQKEKSLLIAEEKYRTVADFTYDWETWVGTDGNFIYVSPSCEPTTGYTVDEFMKDPSLVIKITHPDDREMVASHYAEKSKRNLPSCFLDFRIITRSGEERWIGHSCQPVFNAKGKWIGQRGSNRDITARKKTESILLASQLQLRALTKRMDAIAEEERTRISREIHDELGHLLTALKFDVQCLISRPDISPDQLGEELSSMSGMLDSLIDTVRKIATDLRPGILDHFGLCPAVEWQIEQFQKRTNIKCEYIINETDIDFNKNETTIIYRILQEILTNIARHSKATMVDFSLSQKDGHFLMITSDNGIGFEVQDKHDESSLGLMGMSERALSIGGNLKIESEKGRGTKITLQLDKK